jgi:lysophospholipase L1-like esterase
MTLKLDEPEGCRNGVSGAGATLKLLILGDSAAAGVGVTHQRSALSGQLEERLAKYYSLAWRLEAESGLTTLDVIHNLDSIEAFETDLVLISLGVNDVTSKVRLKVWLKQQDHLRRLLVSKFKAKHIFLSSLPPVHKFPALPQPLRWYLGRRAKAFNAALAQQSLSHDELEFISLSIPMSSAYLAEDGFHPSVLAYQVWSNIAADKIHQKFAEPV